MSVCSSLLHKTGQPEYRITNPVLNLHSDGSFDSYGVYAPAQSASAYNSSLMRSVFGCIEMRSCLVLNRY